MIWKHDLILLSAKLFLELSSLTISSVYSFTTMLGNSVRSLKSEKFILD